MAGGLSMGNFKRNLGGSEISTPQESSTDTTVQAQEELENQGQSQEDLQQSVQGESQAQEIDDSTDSNIENIDDSSTEGESQNVGQPTNNSVQPDAQSIELTDDLVNNYLSEKLGKQFNYQEYNTQPDNTLDSDPYLKEIYDWRKETGRPLEDFFKYQKDYTQVSDIEVAREFLQMEYPTLNASEINLELQKFVPSEEDLENETALKNLELKKLATKGRAELDKLKKELKTPVNQLSPELQSKIEYADSIKSQIAVNEQSQLEYNQKIEETSLTLDSIELPLGQESIKYLIPEDKRKTISQDISDMSHWKNQDGSWNHKAVIEDGLKIKYFNEMLKLAYEQGINSGKDAIIKETGNVTLDNTPRTPQPNSSNKGFRVESESNSGRRLTMNSFKKRN